MTPQHEVDEVANQLAQVQQDLSAYRAKLDSLEMDLNAHMKNLDAMSTKFTELLDALEQDKAACAQGVTNACQEAAKCKEVLESLKMKRLQAAQLKLPGSESVCTSEEFSKMSEVYLEATRTREIPEA